MRVFLAIVVGVLLLNAALLYSGGFDYIKKQFEPDPPVAYLRPEVVDTFRETLEDEVKDKIGVPIEGYEPAMFLEVFPGLVETDFNGVEASLGEYVITEGELELQLDPTELVHSAAGAINRQGYETLYRNIATRIGSGVGNGATLTKVINSITSR